MDPATAFQIGCGCVQLVEVGLKTAKELREIYKSSNSLTAETQQLQDDTDTLRQTHKELSNYLNLLAVRKVGLTPQQQQLRDIAAVLDGFGNQILHILEDLEASSHGRKRDLIPTFVRFKREKSNLDKLSDQIQRQQQLLDTAMLVNLCQGLDAIDLKHGEILAKVKLDQLQSTKALTSMTSGFRDLVQDVSSQIRREGDDTRALIQSLEDRRQHSQFSRDVLDSLRFDTINARQENIADSFGDTFKWVFDRSQEATGPWTNFAKWSETDDGIYWINGKAGSGKSTLMNYIVQHHDLQHNLKTWASGMTVVTPKFFFWRAGTKEQQSLNGLLRSLLFQMISSIPFLADVISGNATSFRPTVWTNRRLLQAFNASLSQPLPVKICVFIDGLDEFEGDEESLRELLKVIQLIPSRRFKVCVSSRPEPAFIEAFKSCSGLRLQDLNERDIREYTQVRLLQDTRMQEYQARSKSRVDRLIDSLSDKGDGVFLWARLAVQELLRGLRYRDTIEMLQRRLDGLESELDDLFLQLLKRIDPVHQKLAADYLKLALSVNRPLTLVHYAYGFGASGGELLNRLIELRNEDEDKIQECIDEFENLEFYLSTRTAGLLDVDMKGCPHVCEQITISGSGETYPLHSRLLRIYNHLCSHTSVTLVHRSALDFLKTNEHATALLKHSTITKCSVNDLLLKSYKGASTLLFCLLQHLCTIIPLAVDSTNGLRRSSVSSTLDVELHSLFRILEVFDSEQPNRCRPDEIEPWLEQQSRSLSEALTLRGADSPAKYIELLPKPFLFINTILYINPSHMMLCLAFFTPLSTWIEREFHRINKELARYCFVALASGPFYPNFFPAAIDVPREIRYFPLVNALLSVGLDPNCGFDDLIRYKRASHESCTSPWLWTISSFDSYSKLICKQREVDEWTADAANLLYAFIDSGADVNAMYGSCVEVEKIPSEAMEFRLNVKKSVLMIVVNATDLGDEISQVSEYLKSKGAACYACMVRIAVFVPDSYTYLKVIKLPQPCQERLHDLTTAYYNAKIKAKIGPTNASKHLESVEASQDECFQKLHVAVKHVWNEYAHLRHIAGNRSNL